MPPRSQMLAGNGAFSRNSLLCFIALDFSSLGLGFFSESFFVLFGRLLAGPAFLQVFFILALLMGLTFKAFFIRLFGLASLPGNTSS